MYFIFILVANHGSNIVSVIIELVKCQENVRHDVWHDYQLLQVKDNWVN